MKYAALLLALIATPLAAQTTVRGYVRSDGTYVAPHMRSNPNNTTYDNWSTRGNFNPYNGQQGTQAPQPQTYQWQPIQTPQAPAAPRAPAASRCPAGSFLCR